MSTAKALQKKLLKKISLDEICTTHILHLYKILTKASNAPDFQSIKNIFKSHSQIVIKKSSPIIGVIVETREHPALDTVINNVIQSVNIPVQLFHGKNNIDYIMSTPIGGLVREKKVILTQLNVDDLNAKKYNALLLSKLFWKNIIARNKILIFQTDCIICHSSDYHINDFYTFDYIGSKWCRKRPIGIIADGGNGGLSLRDWNKTYSCLERFNPEHWCGGEDAYFAFHIELIGGKIGKGNDCAKFSTQHEFLFKSFGAHKCICLNSSDRANFLKYIS